jgi:hypothetical protein
LNSSAIKSAALSIEGVKVLLPSILSEARTFSIRETSLALMILLIFWEKQMTLIKHAVSKANKDFNVYSLRGTIKFQEFPVNKFIS